MQVHRFNFDKLQDFKHPIPDLDDDLEIKEEEITVAPPPPPTFSLNDLETAKRISFEEGRQAGIKEGHEQANSKEREQLLTVDRICGRFASELAGLRDRHAQYMLEQSKELSGLVMMICRKVAGDITNTIPSSGIEQMVNDCLGILTHQPRVNLVVHPDMANHMGEIITLKLKQAHIDCDVQVSGDASLQQYEGRLEWKNGSVERDVQAIWQQVETKLQTVDFAQLAQLKEEPQPVTIHSSVNVVNSNAAIVQADDTNQEDLHAEDHIQADSQIQEVIEEPAQEVAADSAPLASVVESLESPEILEILEAIEHEQQPEASAAIPKGKRTKVEDITTPTTNEEDENG